MRLDLYLVETAFIARTQTTILNDARKLLNDGKTLSSLENSGVLHAFQVLTENAIGKAKQTLKAMGIQVPVSAYDCFSELSNLGIIADNDLGTWNAIVGLRNRIVHDYMNIDMMKVLGLVKSQQYLFIADFLLTPIIE